MIGRILFWIVIAIMLFSVFTLFAFVIPEEFDKLKRFCKNNGYDDYEKATMSWNEDFCIKIEKDTVIKREVQICNKKGMTLYDYCFVEMEDLK